MLTEETRRATTMTTEDGFDPQTNYYMNSEERSDLYNHAQDVAHLATTLTGLHRELSNIEWDLFVAKTGREIVELIVKRVDECREGLEAQAESEEQ